MYPVGFLTAKKVKANFVYLNGVMLKILSHEYLICDPLPTCKGVT